MGVHEIITKLTRQGARIEVVDDSLSINAKKGTITPELNLLIAKHKRDIINFINRSGSAITPAPEKAYYKLSSTQQRLYFVHELNQSSLAYNDPRIFRLEGLLDRQRLSIAFEKLIQRHEILRTSFEIVGEEPVQKVYEHVDFAVTFFPVNGDETRIINDFIRPFDLSKPSLLRVGLAAISPAEHLLMVDIHHIVTDGISLQVLIRDFLSLYNNEQLAPLSLHYKDYAEWQQSEQQREAINEQKEFWRNEFSGEPVMLDLPLDFARPVVRSHAGDVAEFELNADQAKKLKLVADAERTTLFSVIFSIYNILLAKLANQEDVVVGTVTAGRQRAELEQMMGMFVNTLAIRSYPKGTMTFREFLSEVKAKTLECFSHQSYPFEALLDELKVERDASRNPLFDVMFIFQNFEEAELTIPGIMLRPYNFRASASKFDMTLTAVETHDRIRFSFEYSTELFRKETIDRFINYFKRIVSAVTADVNLRISDVQILSDDELDQLLRQFNNTRQESVANAETIVSRFEQQVLSAPERIAVSYEGRSLTYEELNARANQLAFRLRSEYGIGPDQLVGIMVERSELMVIGLLAILKAGGAYVPIDPAYPRERVAYILKDSTAKILLVSQALDNDIPYNGVTLQLDTAIEGSTHRMNMPQLNSPADLCYLIYTSGSTGQPKGVMVSHGNVVNFFRGMSQQLPVDQRDCMLAVTSTSFDISVLELLWTICCGTEVVIHPSDVSLSGLDRYLESEDLSMEFSLFFFSSYNNKAKDKYRLLLDSVRYADQQGFKAVWTPERHFHEFGGLYPNPSVVSSALAMVTRKIELRSGSVVSPLHDPLRIAEEWSMVDNLSKGRIAISFASGWNPNDFVLAKTSYKDRQKTMYDQIETVRRLWKGESLQRTNGFGQDVNLQIFPKPIQKDLPVWITSGGNPETFKSAGMIGANVLTHFLGQDVEMLRANIQRYREARKQAGFDRGKVAVMVHTFIGHEIDEVERLVEKPFIEYLKSSIGLGKILFEESGLKEEELPDEVREKILKNAFKRYYETSSLIGTKESCGRMVQSLKEVGADEVACLIDFGIDQSVVMEGLKNLSALKDLYVKRDKRAHKPITVLQSTPSYLRLLQEDPASRKFVASLRTVLVGGEAVPASLIQQLRKRNRAGIFNMYGPTETTIWSCMYKFDPHTDRVSIGKPILNTQVYILNNDLRPVPIGVAGDLYIGGDGVARGYWKKPDLTAGKFISDPFLPGSRIYATGDVAKWMSDGNLEFLGRKDHQVKLRGFRIELEEVQEQLLACEGVKEAVVVVKEKKETGDKMLVAYYVPEGKVSAADLRRQLGSRLPYYMIPGFFEPLKELPLTPNGKLNRKALPDPEVKARDHRDAPETQEEKLLADVWSKVLGVERISASDNFFAVGGDSIKSIQIVSRMRSAGYEVAVKDIFTTDTLRELSRKLKKTQVISDQSVVTGEAILSPIQRWFFEGSIVDKHHYNQVVMLNFETGISAEIVRNIFSKLQEHHDALRMVFRTHDGKVIQENIGLGLPVALEVYDLKQEKDPEGGLLSAANKIQAGIDLTNGPLMKLGLFHMKQGSRLLIVIHHAVIDGISWRILFEDIESLYQQIRKGMPLSLPMKTDPFKAWPTHLLEYMGTERFRQNKMYWANVLQKTPEPLRRDFADGENIVKDNDVLYLTLSNTYTSKLLTEANAAFNTQINDILLAALLLAVRKQYGINGVMIDLEGHGREEIKKDCNVTRTVGWFTSIYPVFLESDSNSIPETLKQVKEIFRRIPNKGLDYLLFKHYDPEFPVTRSRKASEAQIFFNYLGQFDADTKGNSYTIAKEATGDVVSRNEAWDYDWDIVGMVTEGQLRLRLMYGTRQYQKQTIEALLVCYEQSLKDMIDHCCNRDKTERTPADFTYKELSLSAVEQLQRKYDIQDIYVLSPMQEALLFHSLLDSESDNYFLQISHRMNGDLDLQAVERSLHELVLRYDILRTVFLHQGFDRPIQVVLKERQVDFSYKDIENECVERPKEAVTRTYELNDRGRKFDLSSDALIRLTVLQTGENEFEFIWSYHHIVMDGWCIGLIIDDFKKIYSSLKRAERPSLPPVKPYARYIEWLEEGDRKASLEHWRNYLSGYESIATLPKREVLTAGNLPYAPASYKAELDEAETKSLHKVSREYGVTINTILQVAWAVLLSRYNNVQDVVFGSVVSGRPAEIDGAETMVGLFINAVPVRIAYTGEQTIGSLLRAVQHNALESDRHNYVSLAEIQSQSTPGRWLLDHIMLFDNFPIGETINDTTGGQHDFTIDHVRVFEQTNYDLSVVVAPEKKIQIRLDYNASVFDRDGMAAVSAHLRRVLEQMMTNCEVRVSDIDLITPQERQKLLYEYNDTAAAYPNEETVMSLFERQAAQTPDNPAVIFGERTFTYDELDQLSYRIAAYLQQMEGVQKGDLVGVMLEREAYLIPVIFGILRAGAAYVPIDPWYPVDRINAIIGDSKLSGLVTRQRYLNHAINAVPRLINLDRVGEVMAGYRGELNVVKDSSSLAYVIYTSGSTGKPKGVMIEHRAVVNRIHWMQKAYPLSSQDVIMQKTPLVFDVSVWELFWWSVTGASLALLKPGGEKDPEEIMSCIHRHKVTTLHFVPSMLGAFLSVLDDHTDFKRLASLRQVFASGEALKTDHVALFGDTLHRHAGSRLINLYGPTEATVDVSYYECVFGERLPVNIPIGRPIDNIRLYVLNSTNQLSPVNVPGELCIAGVGLARGYLNNNELTEAKFVKHPYLPDERIYRTGDLVRWLPDGNIEFLGRIDHQVKIKGFRIELEEIEHHLHAHDAIKESVVIARERQGDKYLVCYYLSETTLDADVLKEYLAARLPDYMIPSYFLKLESFPLTSNGKLDRKALPDPEIKAGAYYIAPVTDEEKMLATIWSKVLGVERIGVTDNFFSVGGDSIKSIQISSRIRSAGYEVSVKDILTSQTIRELTLKLKAIASPSDQSAITGKSQLTPIQKWFFESDLPKAHFNQSVLLNFSNRISEEAVRRIFEKITAHHDALRMVFRREGDTIIQQNLDTGFPLSLTVADLRQADDPAAALASIAEGIQAAVDLENGPLMRLGLFQMKDGSRLLIVIHHLVVDGISWRILFEDIESLYQHETDGSELSLPMKTDPYLSWSGHLKTYAQGRISQSARKYWSETLAGEIEPLARDHEQGENTWSQLGKRSFTLNRTESARLLKDAHAAFGTQVSDLLLATLALSILQQYGRDAMIIDMEGHGREEISQQVNVSRTVGWFTVVYPILLEKKGDDISGLVKSVKEMLRSVPNNGIDYLLHREVGMKNTSRILFNYLGQFDADLKGTSFKLAEESKGSDIASQGQRSYDWEFTGIITGGEFGMTLAYSRAQYNEETIDALMNFCEANLLSVIDYCCSRNRRALTPSDLTYKGLSIAQLDVLQEQYEIEDIYSLSPMQEGILFHTLLDPNSDHYFEQITYRLKGDVDLAVLEKSFAVLINRYDILRTCFLGEKYGLPLQVVLKRRTPDFVYRNIRHECATRSISEVVYAYQLMDRDRKFDLTRDSLMRLSVFQTAAREFVFIWSHHHLIMDGWCMSIVINDFTEIYRKYLQQEEPRLPEVVPYSRYIQWLEKRDKESSVKYWSQYLESYEGLATLPKKELSHAEHGPDNFGSERLTLDALQTKALAGVSAEYGVTLNTILQAAWSLLLARYNNVNDVVFGSVVAGRPAEIEGVENMVGLFINTVPVRVRYGQDDTIVDLLQKIQHAAIESEPYCYQPLSEIQLLSELGRGLLDHIIAFDNYPISEQIEGAETDSGLQFTVTDTTLFERPNYDLWIIVTPGNELSITLGYNTNVYDPDMIRNASQHLRQVLLQILADSRMKVSAVEVVTPSEKQQILHGFNNTTLPYASGKLMHELFEEQVRRSPDAPAIVSGGITYSYAWLNAMSNQLACMLREKGAERESAVAVIMNRGIELIVSLFGILKAGGKYVPIEPHIPASRKQSILNSVSALFIITNETHVSMINDVRQGVLSINGIFSIDLDGKHALAMNEVSREGARAIDLSTYSALNLPNWNSSDDLAYVIFTSGSTGQPKGVAVQHRPVINLIEWITRTYQVGQADKILLVSSISFDLSVYDIFGGLAVGASVRIANEQELEEPETLARIILEEGITFWDSAPAMLQQVIPFLMNQKDKARTQAKLRLSFSSGDWIPLSMPVQMKELFSNYRFIALGGATEATVWSNYFEVDTIDPDWKSIPYGKPIQNARYLVLDRDRNLCPVGIAGDLYIGGQCLAVGYFNDEALSAQKFIKSPFYPGEMLYNTGDTARWYADGNIEFLGRKDSQVKIRGYRIELGEIESRLLNYEGIDQALAHIIARSKYDKFICVYYLSKEPLREEALRAFLATELPAYMLPQHFIRLDSIPVTKNGKVDRKRLPQPKVADRRVRRQALTQVERKLVGIWSELLNLEEARIDIQSDFFNLGGHSILAVYLMNAVQQKFSVDIRLREIFSHPTIEKLASLVEGLNATGIASIPVAEPRDHYPASPAQSRLYYEQMLNPDTLAYNVSSVFTLKEDGDLDVLNRCFQSLIDRHEVLRTGFELSDNGVVQKIGDHVDFAVQVLDSRKFKTVEDAFDSFVQPFDLSMPALIRCALLSDPAKGNTLFVDIHHIVCDGISLNILMNEFRDLYYGRALPPLNLRYVDYALWLNNAQHTLADQQKFWKMKLAGELPVLDLPVTQSRDSVHIHQANTRIMAIRAEQYQRIREFTVNAGVTDFMFFLSAYYILLSRTSGNTDIIIGSDGIGRTHARLKNIVGTFINLLPLRMQIRDDISFNDFLKDVKACVLDAFDNQDFQFDQMIPLMTWNKELSKTPVQVHFSFANFFDAAADDGNAGIIPYDIGGYKTTQYEFKLEVREVAEGFDIFFVYSPELYADSTIEIFIDYYNNILTAVTENSQISIGNVEIERSLSAI